MTLGREDLLAPRRKGRWVEIGYLKRRLGDATGPPRVIIVIKGCGVFVANLKETLQALSTGKPKRAPIFGKKGRL